MDNAWLPISDWSEDTGPFKCLVRLRLSTDPNTGVSTYTTTIGYYGYPGRWDANAMPNVGDRITHWMSLPEDPI